MEEKSATLHFSNDMIEETDRPMRTGIMSIHVSVNADRFSMTHLDGEGVY